MSFAQTNQVLVQSKAGLQKCVDQEIAVTANIGQDISAVEVLLVVDEVDDGFLDNLTVVWDLDAGVLTNRVEDYSMVDGTAPDVIRFAAMSTGPTPENLGAGTGVAIATLEFTTSNACDGHATVAGYTIPADPPFGEITTAFVDAATSTLIPVPVTGATVGIQNDPPTLQPIVGSPFTKLHGQTFTYNLVASDPDLTCETKAFFMVNGPDGMTVNTSTGVITWVTNGDDVCEFDGVVEVGVRDACQAEATQTFEIFVDNNPPQFTVFPTELVEIAWGMTYEFDFDAVDPDPGPYGPFFSVINWGYAVPAPDIDANTGELSWPTMYEPEYTGVFEVMVKVDDGANICDGAPENADTVVFEIQVVPFQLTIAKIEDVILGQEWVVPITMLDDTYVNKEIGGFDFLIQYDNSAMTFTYAEEGDFLVDCEWEYFTYRFGPNGNCGPSACPTGVVRIVAMGETTGGNLAHQPLCYTNSGGASNELVKLHFLVSNNALLECQFAPIRWVWYDCSDNGVSSKDGEFLFISDLVYDFGGFDLDTGEPIYNDVTGLDNTMPTLTGAPAPECDVETTKGHPWRLVHFYNGGLDLICADSIDAVGDINLNNIAYEIADAVMFTNYFIEGLSAFEPHVDGSIAASDTNKDGITLSVADLVYLIRVIVGDAQPYPKVDPVVSRITYDRGVFGVERAMGAAHIVVEGNATPILLADNMEMKFGSNGRLTNILVWSRDGNSFSGNFLQVEGRIVSTEFATDEGQPVVSKVMPTTFTVGQNYPNPFNPTSKIDITVPNGSWTLNIYNINGRLVESFSGVSESGFETIEWDASDLSSGVYLYKVVSGDQSMTKKAVLLK